jgi:hypothetical protein
MKKVKVYPTGHDPMLNSFYTYEESLDLFGEPDEYELSEHYLEIPLELQERYIKAREEFFKVESEFTEYLKKSGKFSYI